MIDLIDWIMKLDHNYDVLHYFPLIGTSSAPSMARDCDQEMTLECKKEMQNATNRKYKKCISQGCQRFETSVFFSEKINISTTGGSRVGFFQPDTNHP